MIECFTARFIDIDVILDISIDSTINISIDNHVDRISDSVATINSGSILI